VPPITVDPDVLSGAGESIGAVGDQIATAVSTLASGLSGGARSGLDPAGLAFGYAYQQSAQALLDAGAAAANAGRGVGFGVQMSATNYSRADAASTIGGGASPLTPPDAPTEFSAPVSPSALGGGVPPPLLWSVIQTFIPDVWPDGDPAALRATASAWQGFAATINGIAGQLAGPAGVVADQQIPEGGNMTSAISELTQSLSAIASEADKLATQTREFAYDVDNTQNAIRDLLDRVSPSGLWDGFKAVLSGDALEELKEVADDVKTVLGEYARQAEARRDILQIAMGLIDDAVVSVEKWARREFPRYLGDDVGNAVATALDFELTLGQGILGGAVDTVEGIGQFDPLRFAYDPEGAKEAWGALAKDLGDGLLYATPTGVLANPAGAFNHYKDQVTDAVHAEDWSSDRPGYGPGKIVFDVGASFIPGGAATRTGSRIAGEAADAATPGPGRVPGVPGGLDDIAPIGQRAEDITTKLNNLDDNLSPAAIPNPTGPAIPPSLVEPPGTTRTPEAPGPRPPDAPTPRAPDSTPVDRTPVPHNSTPTATPHAPDTPPVDRTPTAPHSPTTAGTPARVPAADLPANGQHSTPAPSASAPASSPAGPTAPPSYEPPIRAPGGDSPSSGTSPVEPGTSPNGSGPHGQPEHHLPSGNADNGSSAPQKPDGDDPPNPPDPPNNPPHTGLHDPPANHATPGDRLPDLTDINNEYRLPSGAVDPDRFDKWTEKVAEAYPTITKEGVEGVYNYTTQNYQGMNPYLRNVDELSVQQSGILGAPSISDMTDAQRASWEAQIRQTDEGLAALPPYRADPTDMTSTTWRGIQASDSLLDQLKVGNTFSDPGYLSTSTNPQLAEAFARADPDATPTLVTVVGRDGVDVKDLSRYMDESEILFPRSTQFEVVFREMGPDGLLRITLRQVDP
jgi:hypothetical protein